MEVPLTKLIMVVVSLAIAGAVAGIMWTMWSTFATSHDFTISSPVIYDFGSDRRVLVVVKNMGSVPVSRIQVDPDNDGSYEIDITGLAIRQGDEYQVDATFTDPVNYPQQTVAIRVTFQDDKVLVKLYDFPVKRS